MQQQSWETPKMHRNIDYFHRSLEYLSLTIMTTVTQALFWSIPGGIPELLSQQRYHFWRPPACSLGGKGASVWPIHEKLPLGCPGVHCCQGLSTLRCQGAETRCYRDASESSSGGWVWKGGPMSVTPEWLIGGLISYHIKSTVLVFTNAHKPYYRRDITLGKMEW